MTSDFSETGLKRGYLTALAITLRACVFILKSDKTIARCSPLRVLIERKLLFKQRHHASDPRRTNRHDSRVSRRYSHTARRKFIYRNPVKQRSVVGNGPRRHRHCHPRFVAIPRLLCCLLPYLDEMTSRDSKENHEGEAARALRTLLDQREVTNGKRKATPR